MSAPILKVDITANANQLLAAINKAKAKFNELSAKVESLPTGDKQFNKLARELARTENTIQQLSSSYNKLGIETERIAPNLQQLGNSSKNARTALTSLSLTIQDLPFGFLGIQNNLPGVIQGFGNLTATTNGKVLPALKEIGKSLAGPAGLFLGFSAVTAVVTTLIQKYGSLSQAFDQLTGVVPKITDAQKKYNESLADSSSKATIENAKVNILLKTLNDLKQPQQDRLAAYEALKKISPDITKGISDENALSETSIKLINQQAIARKELLKLKITEAGISAALAQNEQKLATLNFERTVAKQKETVTQEKYNATLKNQNIFARNAEQGINTYAISLTQAKKEVAGIDKQIANLVNEQNAYLNQLDPIINGISNLEQSFRNSEDALKKQQQALKDAAKEKGYYLGFSAQAVIAGMNFDRAVKKQAETLAKEQKNLEGWRYILMRVAQGYDMISESIGNSQIYLKSFGRVTDVANKGFATIFENAANDDMLYGLDQVQNKINKVFTNIDEKRKKDQDATDAQYKAYKNAIESFLIQPLSYLSDVVLKKAAFSWKDFGNIIIQQLQRIAVQIAATAIAGAIANVIAPGSTAAAGGAATLLGGVRRGRAGFSAVDFNGLQGGMSLSGQVVFVQRGSDLVGVLNRTNATINRVG